MEEDIDAKWRTPGLYIVMGALHNGAKLADIGTRIGLQTNHWGVLLIDRGGIAYLWELDQESKRITLNGKQWDKEVKKRFHTKWWLGETPKPNSEADEIIQGLEEKYQQYNVIWRNCQGFARDLVDQLQPRHYPVKGSSMEMKIGLPIELANTMLGKFRMARKGRVVQ